MTGKNVQQTVRIVGNVNDVYCEQFSMLRLTFGRVNVRDISLDLPLWFLRQKPLSLSLFRRSHLGMELLLYFKLRALSVTETLSARRTVIRCNP